jgi:predicted transcriptional regulator
MRVLLSIKPEYAEKILSGEKKYEFRRAIFKDQSIKIVVIYASSPIRKVIGEFDIEYIITQNLDKLWEHTKQHSGIDKEFYDTYFCGKEVGHAIKVKQSRRYQEHQDLDDYAIKHPPQSFLYLNV